MFVFARRIEHPLDMPIERPQHADARLDMWPKTTQPAAMEQRDTVGLGALGIMALAVALVLLLTIALPAITADAGILGFAGNLFGAMGTLMAAAVAWIAVQRQINVQRNIADRQSAIQEWTALELILTADISDRELLAAIDESCAMMIDRYAKLFHAIRQAEPGRHAREDFVSSREVLVSYRKFLTQALARSGTAIDRKIDREFLDVETALKSVVTHLNELPAGLEGSMKPIDAEIIPGLEAADLQRKAGTLGQSIKKNLDKIENNHARRTKLQQAAAHRAGIV